MFEFFDALSNPDVPFLRFALIAGVLSGFSFGVVGTYVVARRISYIAGAISHSVLGGIGAGIYLQRAAGWTWFDPIYGALIAALASALIIGCASLFARQREDTVIGAIWAVGMALGLVFLAMTPGYVDPMSYLFGNILLVTSSDIWIVLALDVVVVGLGLAFYNQLMAVCFDEEFARARGLAVHRLADGIGDRYRQRLVIRFGLARAVRRRHDDDRPRHRLSSVAPSALSSLSTISPM